VYTQHNNTYARFHTVKNSEQITMMCFGILGIFGIQVGLYELIQGVKYPKAYGILFIGSFLALVGFGRYKSIQENEGNQ
jgi:hypothetical protein